MDKYEPLDVGDFTLFNKRTGDQTGERVVLSDPPVRPMVRKMFIHRFIKF
jgi:hypothetical protein